MKIIFTFLLLGCLNTWAQNLVNSGAENPLYSKNFSQVVEEFNQKKSDLEFQLNIVKGQVETYTLNLEALEYLPERSDLIERQKKIEEGFSKVELLAKPLGEQAQNFSDFFATYSDANFANMPSDPRVFLEEVTSSLIDFYEISQAIAQGRNKLGERAQPVEGTSNDSLQTQEPRDLLDLPADSLSTTPRTPAAQDQ